MLDDLKRAAVHAGADRRVRALLLLCRRLLSERGEANSVAIARELVAGFTALPEASRDRFFLHLAHDFDPDPQAVLASAQAYARESSAAHLLQLTRDAEPPRQELLRRINRLPGGTAHIVAMRRALLPRLKGQPELAGVEADFLHLLGSWFNPGFLRLQRVDWHSPAQLLEQLIRHEAVHAIDGWEDLRRRLQPDRRCFAFFHPQLPDEPLIFVEVALLPAMPAAILPLIDKASQPQPPGTYRVAAFYSISNCQPGLRGVSLGNFLIKRVAAELRAELPRLRTFCTLSPVPGLARWLRAGAPATGLPAARARQLATARQTLLDFGGGSLDSLVNRVDLADRADLADLADAAAPPAWPAPAVQALKRLTAAYLVHLGATEQGDPVARFHLDNGARVERLNPLGDLSAKGLRQSFGMMVNYLYDLQQVEAHREQFVQGQVAHSRNIAAWL